MNEEETRIGIFVSTEGYFSLNLYKTLDENDQYVYLQVFNDIVKVEAKYFFDSVERLQKA